MPAAGAVFDADGPSEHLAELSRRLPPEVLELVPELRGSSREVLAELGSDVQSLLRERLTAGQAP